MQDPKVPFSLSTDQLIQRQCDHARALGYSDSEIAFLARVQNQKAQQLGHELFHAFTVVAILTDFMESIDDCVCIRNRKNQNA
jgi:hypothetical protein